MFTHFGLHKKPAITYKRKARPSSNNDLESVFDAPSNPVLPVIDPAINPKSADDLDIFDFPEDEDDTLEVELMVATERPHATNESQQTPSKARPRKPKSKSNIVKRTSQTTFCPKPNGVKPVGPKPIVIKPKPATTLLETYISPSKQVSVQSQPFQTTRTYQLSAPIPPTTSCMSFGRPTQPYTPIGSYNSSIITSHDTCVGRSNSMSTYTSTPTHLHTPTPTTSTNTSFFTNDNQFPLQTWPIPFVYTTYPHPFNFAPSNPSQPQLQPYTQPQQQTSSLYYNHQPTYSSHHVPPLPPVQSIRSNRPKKQKMNLVSRLKGASGNSVDTETKPAHHFEFSDDDEETEEIYLSKPPKQTVEPPPVLSPEPKKLPHKEQMEKELEFLMKAEFGTDTMISKTINRPRYMPENPMKVRVTYKRSNGEARKQNEQEELERLEKMLLELREE